MKTTLLITLLTASAAMAQTTPGGSEKLEQAKSHVDAAKKRKAETDKAVADAEAEYRKLQGRVEPTAEESREMLSLFNQWQSEIIASQVTMPKQFADALKKSQEHADELAKQYRDKLATLKVTDNAADCEGLGPNQKWTACKDPAPVSGK